MKKIFSILCLLMVSTNISMASQFGGLDAGNINTQYMKDLRFHEAAARSREKSAIIKRNSESETQAEPIQNANLKSIVFVNNNIVPSENLLNIVRSKIDQPMTAENIAAIRKDIMRYYQSLGFYSAVAMIASQNNKDGELVIEIEEGNRNSIEIEE